MEAASADEDKMMPKRMLSRKHGSFGKERAMARTTFLSVDDLEGRTLLSITYSLTTNGTTYEVGQPIHMTFTEANAGNQPVTVSLSPTDFSISERGGVIWQSNPANAGQPPEPLTLQPGQSVSQMAIWLGTIPQGSYAVNEFGTFTVSNPNAPQGLTATFQLTDPLQGSLITDQSIYTVGESVQLTFTETNSASQAITVFSPGPLFEILQNNQPLLPIPDPIGTYETFAPGQTIMQQFIWDGQSFFGTGHSERPTGSFVAEAYAVPADPGGFTADFQIVASTSGSNDGTATSNDGTGTSNESTGASSGGVTAGVGTGATGAPGTDFTPVVYSTVSSNKDAYRVGQKVRISLNIQVGGDADVALPPLGKHDLITIADGSKVVWKATRKVGRAARLTTISPRHPITVNVVWNGRANQPGVHGLRPGPYTIDVVDGGYGGATTIEIGRKGS
jgi:hypothetical protein